MKLSTRGRASVFLALGLIVAGIAAARFVRQWREEPLFPSKYMTRQTMLSDYFEPLKGTPGDTELYFYDSGKPGGTLLVCGGTHPNEPGAYVAAVTILENLRPTEGRVIVIPRANRMGFTHDDSQEAMPQGFNLVTATGNRYFRLGSRLTNPVKQWPDPSIYINPLGTYWGEIEDRYPEAAAHNPGPGGQMIAGVDSRNLNRVYPGDPDGTITEQVAYAMIEMIRKEDVKLAIDFHEASPEYPTINVMVAHQRAQGITSWAELLLSDDGVQISTDTSSLRLRGLSHREWGDASDVLSVLFESPNVVQGRLKGFTSEDQIVKGYDNTYVRMQMIQDQLNERLAKKAAELEAAGKEVTERSRKTLYVNIPPEGIPIEVRVGRHVTATRRLVESYNDNYPEAPIGLDNLPEYEELKTNGVGYYLHGPTGEPAAATTDNGGG